MKVENLPEKNKTDLPNNFDEVLDKLLLRQKKEPYFFNYLNKLRHLAEGRDPFGIKKDYPGWSEDDFSNLLKALRIQEDERDREED